MWPTTVQCSEGIWTGKCSFFWKSQLHTPRDILFSVESILLGKIVSGAIFRRGYLNWELQVQIFKKSATHASWRQFSNLVSCHCTVLNVFFGGLNPDFPHFTRFFCVALTGLNWIETWNSITLPCHYLHLKSLLLSQLDSDLISDCRWNKNTIK